VWVRTMSSWDDVELVQRVFFPFSHLPCVHIDCYALISYVLVVLFLPLLSTVAELALRRCRPPPIMSSKSKIRRDIGPLREELTRATSTAALPSCTPSPARSQASCAVGQFAV